MYWLPPASVLFVAAIVTKVVVFPDETAEDPFDRAPTTTTPRRVDRRRDKSEEDRPTSGRSFCPSEPVDLIYREAVKTIAEKLRLMVDLVDDDEALLVMKTFITRRTVDLMLDLADSHQCHDCQQLDRLRAAVEQTVEQLVVKQHKKKSSKSLLFDVSASLRLFQQQLTTSQLMAVSLASFVMTFAFVYSIRRFVSPSKLVSLSVFSLIVASIAWKWHQLYLIELAKKRATKLSVPNESLLPCHSLTFAGWIRSKFYSLDYRRQEYFRAVDVDPIWEVNPMTAVSALASEFVLTPLKPLGEHLGTFFSKFFGNLPFYLVIPMFFLVTFVVLLLVLLLALWLLAPRHYAIRMPFATIHLDRHGRSQDAIDGRESVGGVTEAAGDRIENNYLLSNKRYQISAQVVHIYHRRSVDNGSCPDCDGHSYDPDPVISVAKRPAVGDS